MHPKYNETIDKLRMWSQQEKSIQGTLILGSQVRNEFEGDEWSDLDVLLLVDNPGVFLQTDTWLVFLGDIVCVTIEETVLYWVDLTWSVIRVLFSDNRTVDFCILPSDRVDDVLSVNAEIHAHGYEVIYDANLNLLKSKIETTLANVKEESLKIPTEDELKQLINDLLFQLMFTCKKIKRNELWVAVSTINQLVSSKLLQLIEFHTTSITKTSHRIHYDGRFLEQRIYQDILNRLPQCFAKYDVLDAIQTVDHLLDTTYVLSKDICKENAYSFNADQFDRIRKLYGEMFENELS